MDGLVSWFESHGGSFDESALQFVPIEGFGRGALALSDLPEGHVLFTLPRELTLSTRTSTLPARIGQEAWRERGLHIGWTGLILCMMWEEARGPASKWSVYLESLPRVFNTPMFWSPEEIEELNGTSVVDKIGKEGADIDYVEKVLPTIKSRPDLFSAESMPHFTLQNYHIMGSRILSRSFHVEQWDGADIAGLVQAEPADMRESMEIDSRADASSAAQEESSILIDDNVDGSDDEEDPADVAMVPMADVLNARYGSENAKLFYEQRDLRMCTTKPVEKGQQIWNTYGDPPNSDLLRRYGHVDLVPLSNGRFGNPANIVEVRADLVVAAVATLCPAQAASEDRVDWWLEEGGDDVFIFETTSKVPDELVSFARLLLLPLAEWGQARGKGKLPKPRWDDAIANVVKHVLRERVKCYPTTLEDDEKMLAGTRHLSLNKKHALVVRIGEKDILHDTLRQLEEQPRKAKKRKAEDENGKRPPKKR
ncbi:SET domain-containing protein [Vararia minispora EC-137]|uniref:SET domain-containing protein n=1 Tax=Vararia minispora EC-137 TaxID=1314806 RepID=A0ACB8QMA8_9AGAM|nr:SET domain-containing protein [Vararia minispora EC-137]